MNLIDELKQMQTNGKSVVSISHVINRLESIERHECEFCTQIPIYEMSALRSGLKSIWKGGD